MPDQKTEPITKTQIALNILYMVIYIIILTGTIWLVLWGQRRV